MFLRLYVSGTVMYLRLCVSGYCHVFEVMCVRLLSCMWGYVFPITVMFLRLCVSGYCHVFEVMCVRLLSCIWGYVCPVTVMLFFSSHIAVSYGIGLRHVRPSHFCVCDNSRTTADFEQTAPVHLYWHSLALVPSSTNSTHINELIWHLIGWACIRNNVRRILTIF
jgi:hypothetical protein